MPRYLPLKEITTTAAAPAGLPQAVLGAKPSDAYRRVKYTKLKKKKEKDTSHFLGDPEAPKKQQFMVGNAV